MYMNSVSSVASTDTGNHAAHRGDPGEREIEVLINEVQFRNQTNWLLPSWRRWWCVVVANELDVAFVSVLHDP